jgi:hypothetical protein
LTISDFNGEWVFRDVYISSIALKAISNLILRFSALKSIIYTAWTFGKGTLTDPSVKKKVNILQLFPK